MSYHRHAPHTFSAFEQTATDRLEGLDKKMDVLIERVLDVAEQLEETNRLLRQVVTSKDRASAE